MTAHELARSIARARRSSQNGFIREMTADVAGEFGGRSVAACAVAIEGLEKDPVDITFELAGERTGCRPPLRRDRRRSLRIEIAEAAAGPRRLAFARDLAQSLEALLSDLTPVERQRSGDELVEHRAQ